MVDGYGIVMYRPWWWTGTASAVNVGPSMSLGSVEGTGVDDYRGFYGGFMRFPSMGDPQNGWFIMENHNLNGHSHYNNYNPIGECQLRDANILQSSIFPRCSDTCVSDTDRSDSDTILGWHHITTVFQENTKDIEDIILGMSQSLVGPKKHWWFRWLIQPIPDWAFDVLPPFLFSVPVLSVPSVSRFAMISPQLIHIFLKTNLKADVPTSYQPSWS